MPVVMGPPYHRVPIPLEPLRAGGDIHPKERLFLEAVERGDRPTMSRLLEEPDPVNVNCTNILGRSAIQIAVDNENVEIVELLLQQEQVKIGDALLYAIREGVYKIVEMLVNHANLSGEALAGGWGTGEESSDYSPDISPVILAAHCNQFEILQLLLTRGATVETPHPLSCPCDTCQRGFTTDSLRYSLRRIHTYRALASPAWISLTSEDPVLTAFKLSWELERLARQENEFKEIFQELSNQCKKYSCDLLDMCRSTEEVIAVLNRRGYGEDDDGHLTLARLKMALKYNQKQFVAHPNCQQLLTSEWYGGLPVWRGRNCVVKVLLCISLITCIPLIALLYLLFPRSRVGLLIRSPFMKFIYHSASFGFFLMLLVLASTRTEGSERSRQNLRGPPLSIVEWLIFFWVVGMVWSECKQLWEEGFKAYLRQWWNWLDFTMLSLYLATFSLKAVAYLYTAERFGPRNLERGHWPNNDPTLVSEGVFAVANVFSFARIIYLFQTNPHLGPLQISLGCMVIDIAKFLFIFFLVLTSFACGLNQLYWYYDANTEYCEVRPDGRPVNCQRNHEAFMTIGNTFTTLFWSLFGIGNPKSTDLVEDDRFIETVGQGLFMSYHVAAIVVLINMLIAMMTKSFQVIEDHADREWKFARSKLWMSYFDEGSTMPPPFNIIISPKSVYYFFKGFYRLVTRCLGRDDKVGQEERYVGGRDRLKMNGMVPREENPSTTHYQEVMRRLVSRYIHQAKKQLRQGGVNEDDLLEIKQDISSLRYELREDRRNEAERNAAHMEALKRDLMSSHDWDAFKLEVVEAIRDEIKSLLQANSPSLSTSVLYQTHLYTEF